MSGERGFALLAVILVVALLGVAVTEFTFSMRLEAAMVRAWKDGLQGTHLAEAAVQQATLEILSAGRVVGLDETGGLVFYQVAPAQTQPTRLPALARSRVPLGAGEFSYRITDEASRLNLNTASPDRVERLLTALGLDRRTRDVIVDSLQDWKDPDDLYRANGAESEDHYLKLPVPYRARNAPLQDVAELLQIRGVTPDIFWGAGERPGLVALVTVYGVDTVNINTAPVPVLKALGLSDPEISDITQTRVRSPYAAVPGRFAGRGLGVGGSTFRVEAEGLVAGQPRARVVAIVQRGGAQPGPGPAPAPPRSPAPGPGVRPPAPAPAAPAGIGVTVLSWHTGGDLAGGGW